MVPVSVSVWIVTIAGWLVVAAVVLWLFNHVVTAVMEWWKVKSLFFEFVLRRNRCTCGAVGDKRKEATPHA